jgi:hypothetical protein
MCSLVCFFARVRSNTDFVDLHGTALSLYLPPPFFQREREDDPICYSSQPEMVALECMHGGSHGFSLVLPEVLVEWWSRREKRNSESESTEVVGWER